MMSARAYWNMKKLAVFFADASVEMHFAACLVHVRSRKQASVAAFAIRSLGIIAPLNTMPWKSPPWA
jgi:hypothetical protein